MATSIFKESQESRRLSKALGLALASRLGIAAQKPVRFEPGATVLPAFEAIAQLPLLLQGRINCVMQVNDGESGNLIPVSFEAGEIALLSQLFCNRPIWIELTAAEPVSLVWLPVAEMERCLIADASLMLTLVQFFAQRLREVQTRERVWVERGVHHRVCATLLRLAHAAVPDASGRVTIRVTHEELAARCGLSRPKVSQELKHLEAAGHLVIHHGLLEINDLEALDWMR